MNELNALMNLPRNVSGGAEAPMGSAAPDAMEAPAKALPAIDAKILRDAEGMAEGLLLTFGDGDTLTLMVAELTPQVQYEGQVHGFKQKLVDAAAIARNTTTGRSATVADKKAAVREVYDRLLAGKWNKGREAGTGNGREGGLLARAMAEVTGKPVAEAKVWLASRSKEEQAALRLNPKVKVIIDRLRDEADKPTTAGIDSDALLNLAMGG